MLLRLYFYKEAIVKNVWYRHIYISIGLIFSATLLYAVENPECTRINSEPELLQVYNHALKNGNISSVMWALREDLKQAKEKRILMNVSLNLCDIKVAGSRTLFCQTNKGIKRINMPQLSGRLIAGSPGEFLLKNKDPRELKTTNRWLQLIVEENYNRPAESKITLRDKKDFVDATEYFKEYLIKKGLKITLTKIPASQLQATQNELIPDKINQMWWALELGPCNKYYEGIKAPIFVSQDNYVLDGHHRWAAIVSSAFGRMNVDQVMMDVFQINETIGDEKAGLVKLANEFANDFGIAAESGS